MRRIGGTALGVAITMAVGAAQAAPVAFSTAPSNVIELQSGTLATWKVRNDGGTGDETPTGTCSSMHAGLTVKDAVFDPGGLDIGDAFDNGVTLWVDDHQFVAPDTVDVTDQTLTAGPVTMSGLEVTVTYTALQSKPLLRALFAFHNPTDTLIFFGFRMASNVGSDALTAVRASGPDENWAVTSDDAVTPGDPPVLTVVKGPKDRAPISGGLFGEVHDMTFACSGTEGLEVVGPQFPVAPDQTQYVMMYFGLSGTNADAATLGALFDATPAAGSDLLAGIAPGLEYGIVNWTFFGEYVLDGGGNTRWVVSGLRRTSNGTATGGECLVGPGITVQDASITAPTQDDAFDGGVELFVDGHQLVPPIDVTAEGERVTLGPQTVSDLNVSLTYEALPGSPTLRTLARLANPTAAAISTTVQLATNFGSDDHTAILATSDGDTTVGAAERWTISADSVDTPTDAVNTCVLAGPGTPAVAAAVAGEVFACSETNGVLATYALTIGPGETQYVLLFNQLHASGAAAIADVGVFDGALGADFVAGLDNPTQAGIVNWALCRGATHAGAICRIDGLAADATANGTGGKPLDKALGRLAAAKAALQKAAAAADVGKKAAARKGLKVAGGALKTFEKLLKSKKLKTVIAEAIRARLATTAQDVRTQIKGLPTAI